MRPGVRCIVPVAPAAPASKSFGKAAGGPASGGEVNRRQARILSHGYGVRVAADHAGRAFTEFRAVVPVAYGRCTALGQVRSPAFQ